MRNAKTTTLETLDWSGLLHPGDLVLWSQASAEPIALTTALVAARAGTGGFQAFVGIAVSEIVDPAYQDHIAFASYCGTGRNARLGAGLDILPIPYTQLASHLGRRAPVVLLSVAPGRDGDHFSYGAAGDYIADLLDQARLVIAEVSDHYPRTGTGRELRRDQFDILVHTGSRPPQPGPTRFGETEIAIGRHVAGLIEDGSTLQVGLGGIPAAILRALSDHRDLGIHSGLIGDEVALLAEAGVITNARKTIDRGIGITGLLAGGDALMRWANDNPALALRPTSYTHDHAVLTAIDRLVAINSAIEVDLTGQVNAEVAGGRYIGAVGGAGAFLRGAMESRGGLPIIALPSTASGNSRIVANLSGPVSTTRGDVGLVVTEHGVADLRGATIRERRERMLAIADPAHREAIAAQI